MAKKYDRKTEKALIERIRKIRETTTRYNEIAATLNGEKFTTPTGAPFKAYHVGNFVHARRRSFSILARKSPRRATAPTRVLVKRPVGASIDVIASLWTDPNLTDPQFRRMVGAYLNER